MHDKHRFSEEYLNRLRGKIKTNKLLNALQRHIFEGQELTPTQIQAAQILLRKVMPDTQQQEVTQKGEGLLEVFKRLAEDGKQRSEGATNAVQHGIDDAVLANTPTKH